MKALLVFDLDIPEDNEDHWYAVNAREIANAVSHLTEELRSIIKYRGEDYSEEAIKAYEDVRERLCNALEDRDVLRILD